MEGLRVGEIVVESLVPGTVDGVCADVFAEDGALRAEAAAALRFVAGIFDTDLSQADWR
jgi:hypothetical protein